MARSAISSNAFSVDQQLEDAVNTLGPRQYKKFLKAFPEWPTLKWNDHHSWIDTEASDVDVEYSSWCIDWIESNTKISWEDGEPFLRSR